MQRRDLLPTNRVGGGCRRHLHGLPFAKLSPGRGILGPHRDPPGHAVEPGADRIAPTDRTGPACQDQECGLKSVLSGMRVGQDATADIPDHRAVDPHQGGERRLGFFVLPAEEPIQKLAIGHLAE